MPKITVTLKPVPKPAQGKHVVVNNNATGETWISGTRQPARAAKQYWKIRAVVEKKGGNNNG